jgi:hypothetical protein
VTACVQPGCGGTIQDGYCDTCGLAAAAPSAPSVPSAWSGSGQSTRSRSRRTSARSARGRLGAGLVEIPPVPYRDPASAILANPQVAENKRYCSGCDQPVGRAALDWCTTGQAAGNGPILGCEPNARALRFGLEQSYRALARLTPEEDRRIELVDMANAIRPRTLT